MSRIRTIACGHALFLASLGACGPRTEPGDGGGSAGSTAGEASGPASTTADPGVTSAADSTATGMTSAADSTATGGSEGLPASCSCREPADVTYDCDDEATSECAGEALCSDIVGQCARPNPDTYACGGELAYYDDEDVICALEALRDRPSGKLAFDIENDICGLEGCGSDRTELTIVPDGRVVVRRCVSSPISAESSSSSIDTLAEPAYFDECLALATTRERYQCLVGGITRGADVCE